MQQDHRPRHHRLRPGNGCRLGRLFGKINAKEYRHTHSHKEHEQEGYGCSHIVFDLRVDMLMLHDHTQDESRQQHFDMNTGVFTIEMFGHQINSLCNSQRHNCIEQDRFPVLTHIISAHLLPPEHKQHHHDQDDNTQLPAQSHHHDLKRYHQQDCIEVVENSQNLHLFIYP